jgi:hypothetical protein
MCLRVASQQSLKKLLKVALVLVAKCMINSKWKEREKSISTINMDISLGPMVLKENHIKKIILMIDTVELEEDTSLKKMVMGEETGEMIKDLTGKEMTTMRRSQLLNM